MDRRQNHSHRSGLSLRNEILGRKLKHHVNICFAGSIDSGKSTLATRFKDIDEGPYDDLFIARKKNKYVVPIDLDRRPNVKKGGEVVLKIYIEPAPKRRRWFPIWLRAPLISIIVFCFDVNNKDDFYETRERLFRYSRLLEENMPVAIVLGTKIDVRDDPGRDGSKNVVRTKFAKRKTKEWQVIHYFECSAWQNKGVNRLLDFILNLVL
ncbi:hypothetical protein AVEN_55277-1 [Araneus ventricosus]|uniref:Uncharacterized protein n=1 Tax=Araneus ventricosus TaxID=182803 RepID=A0A4Y2D8M4_ARAVE|nr:hypothetical protein AVEN_55277-1 [Araneus ventricosus]